MKPLTALRLEGEIGAGYAIPWVLSIISSLPPWSKQIKQRKVLLYLLEHVMESPSKRFFISPLSLRWELTFHQQNGWCEAITQLPTLQDLSSTPVVCIWVGTWSPGWSISQYMPLDKNRIEWAQEEFKLVRLSHCSSWSVKEASFSRNVTHDL